MNRLLLKPSEYLKAPSNCIKYYKLKKTYKKLTKNRKKKYLQKITRFWKTCYKDELTVKLLVVIRLIGKKYIEKRTPKTYFFNRTISFVGKCKNK